VKARFGGRDLGQTWLKGIGGRVWQPSADALPDPTVFEESAAPRWNRANVADITPLPLRRARDDQARPGPIRAR